MSNNKRLDTLLSYKRQLEDRAAAALGRAAAARVAAEREHRALVETARHARATCMTQCSAPAEGGATLAAAEVVVRARFAARLLADARAREKAAHDFHKATLAPAREAEAAARQEHARARQDRELWETQQQRQLAAQRRDSDRRADADQDDRPPPRR
jgi:hypothetical protein